MDEYLKWLNDQINAESTYVANLVSEVLDGKQKFNKYAFDKSADRHQAFVEARAKYEELNGSKTSDE